MKIVSDGYIYIKADLNKYNQNEIIFSISDTGIRGKKAKEQMRLVKISTDKQTKDPIKHKQFAKDNAKEISYKESSENIEFSEPSLKIVEELVKAINEPFDGKLETALANEKGTLIRFNLHLPQNPSSYFSEPSTMGPEIDEFLNAETLDTKMKTLGTAYSNQNPQPELIESVNSREISFSPKSHKTTFRTPSDNSSLSLSQVVVDSTHFRDKKVLLVDDGPFNLLAASHFIERMGVQVDTAFSGEECLKKLEAKGPNKFFDMVLLDIDMPGMNGFETSKQILKRIREGKIADVTIIALDSNAENREKAEYKKCGLSNCLSKPLIEGELQRVFTKYLGKRKLSVDER